MMPSTPRPWRPETADEFVMRARTWDRQCRRSRDAESELPADMYPLFRSVAFNARQQARELVRG